MKEKPYVREATKQKGEKPLLYRLYSLYALRHLTSSFFPRKLTPTHLLGYTSGIHFPFNIVRGLTRPTVHPPPPPTNKRNCVFLVVFYVLFDIRYDNIE